MRVDYLRVSVTHRCNLRCIYCRPHSKLPAYEILRYEQLLDFVKVGMDFGVKYVRVTGGEPLIRQGIVKFIESLKRLDLDEVSLTTNGIFLGNLAEQLYSAGLARININIPSLNRMRYEKITGIDGLKLVLGGIAAAKRHSFKSIKLNVVVMEQVNDGELRDFVQLAKDLDLILRFIEFMPVFGVSGRYISVDKMKEILGITDASIEHVEGHGPAQYYNIGGQVVGFISGMSNPGCSSCNRLRLTADGKLKPCLRNSIEIDIKQALRDGNFIDELFKKAIKLKEKKIFSIGNRPMQAIGG